MKHNGKRIAILGAGPVGLDAALAAADAGHELTVYEAADGVGEHVRRWGHVRLFTPWRDNVSPRMRRALGGAGLPVPGGEGSSVDAGERPTGDELVRQLLEPLAELPRIRDRLRTGCTVIGVSRRGLVKSDAIGSPRRGEAPFRILLECRDAATGRTAERVEEADVVLDCTGTYSRPNALGDGGLPAPGERSVEPWIDREIPVLDDPGSWKDQRVLLVGSGHSAQTAARGLAGLAGRGSGVRLLWAVREQEPDWGAVEGDPLAGRAELVRSAESLAGGASEAVEVRTGVVVDALEKSDGSIRVRLRPRFAEAAHPAEEEVDRIVSLTGYVGDHSLYRQLQVHECYATSGPMNLSAALLGSDSADCLDQTSHGADTLVNPEPGFFILGVKSYGRNNTFLLRVGWDQVDEVFGLLGTARQVSDDPSSSSTHATHD